MHRIILVILVLVMLLVCLALDAGRSRGTRADPDARAEAPSLDVES
ncbi:MAG: hypothetical protein ACKVXR_18515 [Planctomycetota bacterium]